jgi:hypothetical protein
MTEHVLMACFPTSTYQAQFGRKTGHIPDLSHSGLDSIFGQPQPPYRVQW